MSNYGKDETSHVSVFRFPPAGTAEREEWVRALPKSNLGEIKDQTVICIKHWGEGFETTTKRGGKARPVNPPSIFPGVPKSHIPQATPSKRPTKRSSNSVRNLQNSV